MTSISFSRLTTTSVSSTTKSNGNMNSHIVINSSSTIL